MAFGQPNYIPYPYGMFNPASVRPDTQMGQMYPQPQNVPPAQSVGQTQGISPLSRPVTSREEAMGIAADFSGAPMIFPDMAHNTIFVKRWDYQSGSALFTEYVPKGIEPEASPVTYATQGDFRELSESLEKVLARFDGIETEFEKLKKKGAKKNDADE